MKQLVVHTEILIEVPNDFDGNIDLKINIDDTKVLNRDTGEKVTNSCVLDYGVKRIAYYQHVVYPDSMASNIILKD